MDGDGLAARFCVGALATWRVTHLLAAEDGPADVVVRLRVRAGESRLGGLMDCFNCLSVWTAAPVAAVVSRRPREAPLVWAALSGAACLLERATRAEGDADVLWEEAQAGAGDGQADAGEPGRGDRRPAEATSR